MTIKQLQKIINCAILLAFVVVMLGAYTRLTDAGLGCPDWPGCYGHLMVQSASGKSNQLMSSTIQQYHLATVEPRKAWTEMIHRYAAGTLALFIFFIAFQSLRLRPSLKKSVLPVVLCSLVIFQALLGMWTVTLKLLPIVVMAHLLGGILIFSTLICLRIQSTEAYANERYNSNRGILLAVFVGWFIVLFQVALGGWVSANYAGLACIGFPQCNGQWLPAWHLSQGFYLFSPVGQNYQGGLLDNAARVTIQYVHRLGAVVTLLYIISLMGYLHKKVANRYVHKISFFILILVLLQFCLGIGNVIWRLPLANAVLHNGVAALLMASLSVLVCWCRKENSKCIYPRQRV